MSIRIALAAAITLLTAGSVTSQELLSESQMRRVVKQEIAKSLQRSDPQTRKVAAKRVFLPPGVHTDRRDSGVSYGLIPTPFGGSSVQQALAAAEKAIEADKSLSKRQRVQALKGLERIRKVVGTPAKNAASKRRKGKGKRRKARGARGKVRKVRGAGKGKGKKKRKPRKNKAGRKRRADRNERSAADTPKIYTFSTKGPAWVQHLHKVGQPFPVLLPRPKLQFLWKKTQAAERPATKKLPAKKERKQRIL